LVALACAARIAADSMRPAPANLVSLADACAEAAAAAMVMMMMAIAAAANDDNGRGNVARRHRRINGLDDGRGVVAPTAAPANEGDNEDKDDNANHNAGDAASINLHRGRAWIQANVVRARAIRGRGARPAAKTRPTTTASPNLRIHARFATIHTRSAKRRPIFAYRRAALLLGQRNRDKREKGERGDQYTHFGNEN